jgi:hypothetical protein
MVMIRVDYAQHKEMLEWLHTHVQENSNPDLKSYHSSAVSRSIEWRSRDHESWVFRVQGFPPNTTVSIKDEKLRMLFMLKWS